MSVRDIIPWNRRETSDVLSPRDMYSEPFSRLHEDMNRLFEGFFSGTGLERFGRTGVSFTPKVDVTETAEAISVSAELPGMTEDEIDVSLDESGLVLRGEKREEKEETDKGYHRLERSYGSFMRRIPVPANVDGDKVEAKLDKGVLKITLPKVVKEQGKQIKVGVK